MSVILALAAVLLSGVPTDWASLLCAAPFLIVGAVFVAGVGAILGYLAGALTAGVFLFARWDQRANEAEEQAGASVPVGERAAAAEPPKP
jgi:F0F1-type ATP synthase assembly protein I